MRIYSIYVMLNDGRCIFDQSFTPEAPPKNLITGMLTALQSFVREVTGTYPTHLVAGDFSFHFEKRGPLTVVLTTSYKPETLDELNQISLRFLKKYGNKIETWKGDVASFEDFSDDIEDILGPQSSQTRIDPVEPLNPFLLLEIPAELQDIAKGLIQEREASSEAMTHYTGLSEFLTRLKLEKLVKMGHIGRYNREDEYIYFTN
jgi:hypothetical protein